MAAFSAIIHFSHGWYLVNRARWLDYHLITIKQSVSFRDAPWKFLTYEFKMADNQQRWRWPLAISPNAKIFAMWRKICDVSSHSGEDKNEMLPQYL